MLQYFGLLMQKADSLEKTLVLEKNWEQEEKGVTGRDSGWHHWLNGHEFEQIPGDGEGQGSLVCRSPCSCEESDMTATEGKQQELALWKDHENRQTTSKVDGTLREQTFQSNARILWTVLGQQVWKRGNGQISRKVQFVNTNLRINRSVVLVTIKEMEWVRKTPPSLPLWRLAFKVCSTQLSEQRSSLIQTFLDHRKKGNS